MKEHLMQLASRTIRAVTPGVAARIIMEHEFDHRLTMSDSGNLEFSGIHFSFDDPDTGKQHWLGVKDGKVQFLDGHIISPRLDSTQYKWAKRMFAQRREEIIQSKIQRMLEDQNL